MTNRPVEQRHREAARILARRIACRLMDIDPEQPSAWVDTAFEPDNTRGEFAVEEAAQALANAEPPAPSAPAREWLKKPLCATTDDGTLCVEWIESQPGPRHGVWVAPDGQVEWYSVAADYHESGQAKPSAPAEFGPWEALLSAVRNYIDACSIIQYDTNGSRVSREVAEREAFQRMQAAADRFPHPCGQAESPKGKESP